jgi:hypothetical protein
MSITLNQVETNMKKHHNMQKENKETNHKGNKQHKKKPLLIWNLRACTS